MSYIDAITVRATLDRRKSALYEIKDALGHVPTAFESGLAFLSDYMVFILFGLFFVFFQHYLNILLFYPISIYFAKYRLESFYEHASPFMLAFLKVAFLYLLLSVPFAFLYRIKRKVAVLGPLQVSLAAGAPAFPGGPATCNNCGAALTVGKDMHIVSCSDCETDNLVGMPEKWLQGARSRLTGTEKNLQKAVRNYKSETGLLKETLFCLAVLFAIYGAILSYFYYSEKTSHFLPPPGDERHRQMVFIDRAVKPPFPMGEWQTINRGYAPASRDYADLFLYLTAGEKAELIWKPDEEFYRKQQQEIWFLRDKAIPELMQVKFFRTFLYTSQAKNIMRELESFEAMAGKPFSFTAMVSGYYNFRIIFIEDLPSVQVKIDRLHSDN